MKLRMNSKNQMPQMFGIYFRTKEGLISFSSPIISAVRMLISCTVKKCLQNKGHTTREILFYLLHKDLFYLNKISGTV